MEKNEWKILIHVPNNWFDATSPIGYFSGTVRDEAKRAVKEEVIKQFLSKVTLPEINIPEEEIRAAVKERIVDKLAEKALERNG